MVKQLTEHGSDDWQALVILRSFQVGGFVCVWNRNGNVWLFNYSSLVHVGVVLVSSSRVVLDISTESLQLAKEINAVEVAIHMPCRSRLLMLLQFHTREASCLDRDNDGD